MDRKEKLNNIPCVIDNGIIYKSKDMQRVLRDLGHVSYSEIVSEKIKTSGEGYIVSVLANNHNATIIVNKRVYLNVNGFEYMEINTEDDKTNIDLVDQFRTLRFTPIGNPLSEEMSNNDIVLSHISEYDDEYDGDFAEINIDDDEYED